MLYKQIYEVPFNRQIIINIPENIGKNKKILITIDEFTEKKSEKLNLLKQAIKDPLFMNDLEEVNKDFDLLENETL
jgi:hypothetical protein